MVFCRRSLIKLDEIILSKGKALLVRVIYSDIYLPFDIASFVTRMLKYNIGLNIFEPLIRESLFKKFLILDDSCIAQHILNIYHFYYENLYYKYDIEIQTQRKALNILRNIEQKSNKFLLSHPFDRQIKGA